MVGSSTYPRPCTPWREPISSAQRRRLGGRHGTGAAESGAGAAAGRSSRERVPPWASAAFCAMARPRPAPPVVRLRDSSRRTNGRRRVSRWSRADAGPLVVDGQHQLVVDDIGADGGLAAVGEALSVRLAISRRTASVSPRICALAASGDMVSEMQRAAEPAVLGLALEQGRDLEQLLGARRGGGIEGDQRNLRAAVHVVEVAHGLGALGRRRRSSRCAGAAAPHRCAGRGRCR